MPRWYWKLFMYGIVLSFCVMFGVDLASRGMNRIEGPESGADRPVSSAAGGLTGPSADGSPPAGETAVRALPRGGVPAAASPAGTRSERPAGSDARTGEDSRAPQGNGAAEQPSPKPEPPAPRPITSGGPEEIGSMNHLGNKLGDLLEITAQSGMDGVVSLFEWVVK
ncbi:hypothetical protein [Paenibacillus lutrae]|uniref:Uncharacterized protein n=1 Tax=Paenibacillus lutrae TaxID=2078573 RepID=A0A7X3FGT3_9BACL|nr:hypothetical protein [Paenibacillus lutrae]MVO99479.1 hypothetical protein [Paenibacillus lutrae]